MDIKQSGIKADDQVAATSELEKAYNILDTLVNEMEDMEGMAVDNVVSEPAFYRRLDTCIEIIEKHVSGNNTLQQALDGLNNFSDSNNFGDYDDWSGSAVAEELREFAELLDAGINELG